MKLKELPTGFHLVIPLGLATRTAADRIKEEVQKETGLHVDTIWLRNLEE